MHLFNIYLATIYGTILWMVLEFVITKDRYDDQNDSFDWVIYKKHTWDNWVLAIVGIPFIVHWGPDAVKFFFPGLEWSNMGYGLSGIITQALYFSFKEYRNKSKN